MSDIKFLLIFILIFIINCSGNKVSNYHGMKSLDLKFEKLTINKTNKNDVIDIIGPPTIISDFNELKWFYIERQKTNQSLLKFGSQKIKKNNVLVVELNQSGILINKKLLNLENMNDVRFLKFETKKEFQNKNIMYDVFSSLREKINAPTRNKKN